MQLTATHRFLILSPAGVWCRGNGGVIITSPPRVLPSAHATAERRVSACSAKTTAATATAVTATVTAATTARASQAVVVYGVHAGERGHCRCVLNTLLSLLELSLWRLPAVSCVACDTPRPDVDAFLGAAEPPPSFPAAPSPATGTSAAPAPPGLRQPFHFGSDVGGGSNAAGWASTSVNHQGQAQQQQTQMMMPGRYNYNYGLPSGDARYDCT